MKDLRSLLIIASILALGKLKLFFLGCIAIWNYWNYRSVKNWQLWLCFLIVGIISTLAAPYPPESFWGNPQLNDGLIFWIITAALAATNRGEAQDIMVIRLGAFINFVLWLVGAEPVAHRGHIAAIMTMAFAHYPYVGIMSGLATWNRSALVAIILVNWTKLGWKICTGVAVILIVFTSQKQIPGDWISRVTSGRAYQMQLGIKAIQQRPLFGWGWEGYSQSYPFVGWSKDYNPKYYGYNWFRAGKNRKLRASSTAKIHFWFLDLMVSIGVLGTLVYIKILTIHFARTPYNKEVWAFLMWVLFWFDTADYTGIFWLLLSSEKSESTDIEEI